MNQGRQRATDRYVPRHARSSSRGRNPGRRTALTAAVALAAVPAVGATQPQAQQASAADCTVNSNLVPSCGAWWGVSPDGHTADASEIAKFEKATGRRTQIYRGYHRMGQMFPSKKELAVARDPQGHRILLLSLKTTNSNLTWREVANGQADDYLKRLARYYKARYNQPMMLIIHHEPDNDVIPRAGSGMEATDFAAMYRHVVTVMRNNGGSNIRYVLNLQGSQKFKLEPWWPQLYPGDAYVDWLSFDMYSCVDVGPNEPCVDYSEMVNRRFSDDSPWMGFYNWAHTNHPDKPLVVAEMGVLRTGDQRKANVFRSATVQAPKYPQIKAIAYYDRRTDWNSSVVYDTTATAAAAEFAQSSFFTRQPVP